MMESIREARPRRGNGRRAIPGTFTGTSGEDELLELCTVSPYTKWRYVVVECLNHPGELYFIETSLKEARG